MANGQQDGASQGVVKLMTGLLQNPQFVQAIMPQLLQSMPQIMRTAQQVGAFQGPQAQPYPAGVFGATPPPLTPSAQAPSPQPIQQPAATPLPGATLPGTAPAAGAAPSPGSAPAPFSVPTRLP